MYIIFFFNDTATTEIYTLSLHDALPIYARPKPLDQPVRVAGELAHAGDALLRLEVEPDGGGAVAAEYVELGRDDGWPDRKSTRLNSSHANISYAVFCLKKKK